MTSPGITSITITKGDTTFHVHGGQAGAEGVWLAKGQVEGIYDAPVKTLYKTGAFQEGSTQRAVKKLHRDMELGFHCVDTANLYELNESEFMRMFTYELDRWQDPPDVTSINITTSLSGTRSLDVLMYEQPEFIADIDPLQNQYGNLILKLRAADPMWYGTTVMSYRESSGSIAVENPTDNIMFHEWVLSPGTYTLPDVSWVGAPGARIPGGSYSSRSIAVTVESGDGIARISLDRQKLMIRDSAGTNILARLGGEVFAFPIPPYTQAQTLPVSVSGRAELHQPRRWSRPWGLHIPT